MSELDQLFNQIKQAGPIDISMDDMFKDPQLCLNNFKRRTDFIEQYSWAIPDLNAINAIAKFIGTAKCLEIGSGSGLWAKLLQLSGVNIIATDNKSEPFKQHFTHIEVLNAKDAVDTYYDCDVLMLCWSRVPLPSQFKGSKIVYIGESEGGCTSGIPNPHVWKLVDQIAIPTWFGINDELFFYCRK